MAEVRVLVVDDQPPFRRAAEAVVDVMDGFTVVGSAESGEEAVRLSEELRPDLVLLDVNLPAMSGTETCRHLSRQEPAPIVLLVSTYDPGEWAEDVAECGAAGYLRKSEFGPDRLHVLWEVLGRMVE